ncbi:hypothetical protein BAUCODRAFT_419523 [Baudoinia panamericana UAMH 10762]|uniref:C3H1-type domain-containing protein n=1 Tax=Baudoinia panamericana (strain UAMH 10762) TaxID=717646 RepID=M2LUK7_BAUPA|nr:uncharacterized protein BAUCODRAFT_419523 [Baudoinia panamericana UAMH 10762]EMC98277.1 hypothetical protein BAUCODRAFT_419523 [Baudoinia panamericana UAMH 10762]
MSISNGGLPSLCAMAPDGSAHHSSVSSSDHVHGYWERYEQLKYNDVVKNCLFEDVITRYENLMLKHTEYVKEHQSERAQAKEALQREQRAITNVAHLQNLLNRDPFILVLLDGDGMIFNANFLREGETGGEHAATVLHSTVQEWAAVSIVDCPSDVKVIVRVYANIKDLADVCTKASILTSTVQLEEFARGFTRGKTLFDFVDVGYGKDRADGKVAETFKLFLYDYHCRQILFGCSHDNGYARLLEQYTDCSQAAQRVTLLEGVPFEKELAGMPFPKLKYSGIFRETKINVAPPDSLTGMTRRVDSRGLNAASSIFTPRTATPLSPYKTPSSGIPQLDGALAQRLPHLRTMSVTSSGNTSDSGGAVSSWAAITRASADRPLTDIKRTPSGSTVELGRNTEIQRNRHGHRIDEPLDYDRDEVQRLKKYKMCNQHYIGVGCCHFNAGKSDKCPHRHDVKLTQHELYVLRMVARETPCKKGLYCDDTKCIYGHRCPFPRATEGGLRGSGMCLNGEHCRFGRAMHEVDIKIVKTVRAVGAF